MSEVIDWNKLTITQLKEHLKKRGLDLSGKKADLVGRLIAHDKALAEQAVLVDVPENVDLQPNEDDKIETIDLDSEEPSESQGAEVTQEMDFTENITFEELEQSVQPVESGHQVTEGDGNTEVEESKKEEADDGNADASASAKEQEQVEEEKEAAEAEQEAASEEPDVSNQFSIDMPRDIGDCFRLTWHSKKFVVPFRTEITADLVLNYKSRSLLVYPIEISDLSTDLFQQLLNSVLKFSIDFQDRSAGKTTAGQVRFLFSSSAEAEEAKEKLKTFRNTLTLEQTAYEFKDSDDNLLPVVKKIQLESGGSIVQRLLFVGNLPSDVTEATLSELFPDALRVILPHKEIEENAENIDQTRHAYIEYASEDEAAAAAENNKEKLLNDEKLFVIKAISVRKDRFGLLSDSLRQIFLDKVRKLQRIQKNPYNKSPHDLKEIEKTIVQTKEKLALDTKHRNGWGMLLGRLDESVIDKDEEPKAIASVGQRGRGGNQRGRGQTWGGSFRGGPRHGGQMGGTTSGFGGNQRGGYGYNANSGYGRGGWNTGGYGGGYQSYYGGSDAYPTQSYGAGYNQFSGKRRASYDNYSGDWKRGRGSYQSY